MAVAFLPAITKFSLTFCTVFFWRSESTTDIKNKQKITKIKRLGCYCRRWSRPVTSTTQWHHARPRRVPRGTTGVTTHGPYRSKIHPLLEKIKIVIRGRSRLLRLLVWHGVCCPRMWQFTWESRKKECFHIQTFIRSFWSTWKNKQRTEHNIIYLFSRQHITLENNKSQSMRKYQVWPDGLDDLIMVSKSSLPHARAGTCTWQKPSIVLQSRTSPYRRSLWNKRFFHENANIHSCEKVK